MKRFSFVVGALAAGTVFYAVIFAAHAKVDDQAEIRALEARFVAAFNAKDVDGIMSCYVPDDSLVAFDVIPPRQYVGAKAYRKPWENFLNSVTAARVEMSELRVTTERNVGFGYNIQHVIATDRDGKAVDFTLWTTDGYRKIKGQWLVAHEHFSVPVDLASGRADLASQP